MQKPVMIAGGIQWYAIGSWYMDKLTGTLTNKAVTTDAELLLLPLSIGMQKSMAKIDSGATHNFLLRTMVDILQSTASECISWWYSAEPLQVSLADNTVVLSTKLGSIKTTFDGSDEQ